MVIGWVDKYEKVLDKVIPAKDIRDAKFKDAIEDGLEDAIESGEDA
jgi:hypothetical protein